MWTRKEFLHVAGAAGLAAAVPWGTARAARKRPNLLWISAEDIGPHLGCYGDPNAVTPTLDALAANGTRYTRAYTTAPVCAPNRSCIITGMYAHSLGTMHMRAGGEGSARSIEPKLPDTIQTLPQLLQGAGYYCSNNSKQDYNFVRPAGMWHASNKQAHWRNRPDPDQPFFAVFNFKGSHESAARAAVETHAENTQRLSPAQRQDPDQQVVPPFHPNTATTRANWAAYRENITALDYWVKDLLDQLAEDGLADDTIVIFWSDHGAGLPRCKRWVYQSGTHVPLIVHIPAAYREPGQGAAGTVDNDLVSSVDLAPTTLALAGIAVPGYMQGQPVLGPKPAPPRDFVFGGRDRMDERYDMIRYVRDARYTYVRNYMPYMPWNQYINTAEKSPIKEEMRQLAATGALPPAMDWVTRASKPMEELYDLEADPHELNNIADDPVYAKELERHRKAHEEWRDAIGDTGLIPEPELVVLEKEYGSRYEILNAIALKDSGFLNRLRQTADTAARPVPGNTAYLAQALQDPRPTLRYWGATGLGNLAESSETAVTALRTALDDAAPTVRIAAAHALFRLGEGDEKAFAVLTTALQGDREWNRLQAATALDEMGESARPALAVLQAALNDTENKYVVRVANHAVNTLLGTNHQVR